MWACSYIRGMTLQLADQFLFWLQNQGSLVATGNPKQPVLRQGHRRIIFADQ